MEVSWLPEPEGHPLWQDIRTLLKPAVLSDEPDYEPSDWVWIIYDRDTLYAAATTRLWEGEARLRLAGGTRHREWAQALDEAVTRWARDGGAKVLTARGRRGWARLALAFGWVATGHDEDGRAMFSKDLSI